MNLRDRVTLAVIGRSNDTREIASLPGGGLYVPPSLSMLAAIARMQQMYRDSLADLTDGEDIPDTSQDTRRR